MSSPVIKSPSRFLIFQMSILYHKFNSCTDIFTYFSLERALNLSTKEISFISLWILVFQSEMLFCLSMSFHRLRSCDFALLCLCYCVWPEWKGKPPEGWRTGRPQPPSSPICSPNMWGKCGPEHLKPNKAHLFTQTVIVILLLCPSSHSPPFLTLFPFFLCFFFFF